MLDPSGEVQFKATGKALVMDDEQMVRRVIALILEELGFQVDSAENAEKSIRLFKKAHQANQPYKIVILDLTVPGGRGGKEAIKELLKIDPHANVIVASGYSNDPIMSNYQDYGFKGVVAKPISMETLKQTLIKVLGPHGKTQI